MILHNENFEMMSSKEIAAFKTSLLDSYNSATNAELDSITEEDAMDSLGDWYNDALQVTNSEYYLEVNSYSKKLGFFGRRRLWRKFKKAICSILKEDSTAEEIIEAILKVILTIIPGGVLVKYLAEKIVKYILRKGYEKLCPVD